MLAQAKSNLAYSFLEDLKEILSVGTLAYMAGHPVHLVVD
jgi:hypothetical protein